MQGQQVAQAAEGQTIVYQPVNADGTILQQGRRAGRSQDTSGRGFLFIEVFVCSAGIHSRVLSPATENLLVSGKGWWNKTL